MADVKKIATRESYGNALAECGADFPNLVVLDADLAGATKTGVFLKAFPDRHIDCGIAECNMTGIAAVLQPAVRFLLSVPLRCLRQDVTMSRYAIPSAIRI